MNNMINNLRAFPLTTLSVRLSRWTSLKSSCCSDKQSPVSTDVSSLNHQNHHALWVGPSERVGDSKDAIDSGSIKGTTRTIFCNWRLQHVSTKCLVKFETLFFERSSLLLQQISATQVSMRTNNLWLPEHNGTVELFWGRSAFFCSHGTEFIFIAGRERCAHCVSSDAR